MDGSWKTKEFVEKFPLGYLPAFEGADGFKLQESGAIADYCELFIDRRDPCERRWTALVEVREGAKYRSSPSSKRSRFSSLFMMRPYLQLSLS